MFAPNEVRVSGKMLWWSKKEHHGIILAIINGKLQRFFVHVSGILSGPEIPRTEQLLEFTPLQKPPKPGMLPVAVKVVIHDDTPGVDVLKAGAE